MFEINTAGVHRGNRAGKFRQLIVGIFPDKSSYQLIIVGFTPYKCG